MKATVYAVKSGEEWNWRATPDFRETFDLLQRGLLTKNTVPYSAIGYKQAISFLQQCQQQMDVRGSLSEEWLTKAFLEFLQEFKTVTRNYAKKQYSWFRRVPDGRNETHPPPHYM